MSWDARLPPGCPPADAVGPDGDFIRFVRREADGSLSDDWVLPVDQAGHENRCRSAPDHGCQCYAYSLLADPADIEIARGVVASFRKRAVGVVNLGPEMGVAKNTPSATGDSHHSWWVPEGLEYPAVKEFQG